MKTTRKKKAGRRPKFMKCDSHFGLVEPFIVWGMKAIARELKVSPRTVYLWEEKHGLPVRVSPGGIRWAIKGELFIWLFVYSEVQKGARAEDVWKEIREKMDRTTTCPHCGFEF